MAAETEKAFIGELHELVRRADAGDPRSVGFLVVGAVVLIAANTSAMGVRERIPEIAILKSLGFRRRPILTALLAESTLQGLARRPARRGRRLRRPRSAPSAPARPAAAASSGPLGGFPCRPQVAAEGVMVAILVGFVAGLVPAWNGARLNVVDALRRIF